MVRRIVLPLLAFVALPGVLRAQERLYVAGRDTLRYTYTPLSGADTSAVPSRRGFLRRAADYFERSAEDRTFEKDIDFTFAGGPSYSKATSFGIGLLASGLYRVDRTDSVTQPSNVSFFGSVSVSGFYALGVTGDTFLGRDRHRVDYTVAFASAPRDLWGIGYEAGCRNPRSTYVEKRYHIEGRYLYRILHNTYFGGMLNFQHTQGRKFTRPDYIAGQRHAYTATGVGLAIEYDSRDFVPNPARGLYISLQETLFPKGLGNAGRTLWRTTFTADAYRTLWRGGILAADLYAEYNSQGTPWPQLARLGGSYRMRGYYQGRYTDNGLVTLQVELRQRIWRRVGCTVWGGAGNLFPSPGRFDWSETLPNYGVGFRWELKKRVNVRFDYGFGKRTSGFLLNVNEAF